MVFSFRMAIHELLNFSASIRRKNQKLPEPLASELDPSLDPRI
jgi:hypothetical protein